MATEHNQEQQSEIKTLIIKGKEQGYLTYAEVNDHLPDDIVDPEQIEDIIGMINDMGIEVHEVAPDTEAIMPETPVAADDDTATEEAVAVLSAVDAEVGRTTDPVRMYMREMGTVELLTREGEIAIAKRIEEGLNQVQSALASFPWSIQLLIEEYDQHKEGKKRLSEVLAGFADVEPPQMAIPEPVAADADVRRRRRHRGEGRRRRGSGPRRDRPRSRAKSRAAWKSCARSTRSSRRPPRSTASADKQGAEAARADGRGVPEAQAAGDHDRQLRAQAARGREHDPPPRTHDHGHLHQAGRMPRKDFLKAFPSQRDEHVVGRRADPQEAPEVVVGDQVAPRADHHRAGTPDLDREGAVPRGRRHQGNQPRDVDRRGEGPPREEGDGRGEPSSRDLDREEVHEPRPAVPRSHPGRQHRPDEGGRQVRIPPRLQVLDLRDVVDPPGDHALDRRPGAHDPHPGAHDRDDQQAESHLAPDAAGDGSRADAGRTRDQDGDARGQDPQGAQDRQGTDLDGDADRRRRGFAPRRFHRGRARSSRRSSRRRTSASWRPCATCSPV